MITGEIYLNTVVEKKETCLCTRETQLALPHAKKKQIDYLLPALY